MAAGNSSQHNFRKALGVLKDSTKVGLAKVNSENKDLDIAVVKATNHIEVPPKEKHVRTIFEALSASGPQTDFAYCMQALTKRLGKTSTWTVALKTLIIIHRSLREMVPPIHDELINYSQSRVLVLNMSHFKDESSPNAWYYATWVRYYALYLEERLECYRILKYDVVKDSTRIKEVGIPDLLDQLPALQQLLFRLLFCQPEGVTRYNSLIQHTLSIIAAESVHIYVAITAGNLNLVDKYFEMQRHDAVRAIEIYRKAADQAEKLSEFFEICRGLDFGKGQKYIKIEQVPASFLTAMLEYVKEAPQALVLPRKGNNDEMTPPRDSASSASSVGPDFRTPLPASFHCLSGNDMATSELADDSDFTFPTLHKQVVNVPKKVDPTPQITDLLGLDDSTQESCTINDKNAHALEFANPDDLPCSFNSSNPSSQPSSWEFELVAKASSSGVPVDESEEANGIDRSTLNSLYDNAMAARNQNETKQMEPTASNPFENVKLAQEDVLIENQQQPVAANVDQTKETEASNPFESFSSQDAQPPTEVASNPFDIFSGQEMQPSTKTTAVKQQSVADNQDSANPS